MTSDNTSTSGSDSQLLNFREVIESVGLFVRCTTSDFPLKLFQEGEFNKVSLDCWRRLVEGREAGDLSVMRRLSG